MIACDEAGCRRIIRLLSKAAANQNCKYKNTVMVKYTFGMINCYITVHLPSDNFYLKVEILYKYKKNNYTAKHLFLLKLNPLFPLLAPICCVSDAMENKLAHEQF